MRIAVVSFRSCRLRALASSLAFRDVVTHRSSFPPLSAYPPTHPPAYISEFSALHKFKQCKKSRSRPSRPRVCACIMPRVFHPPPFPPLPSPPLFSSFFIWGKPGINVFHTYFEYGMVRHCVILYQMTVHAWMRCFCRFEFFFG